MKTFYSFLFAGIIFLTCCSKTSASNDSIPEYETFKMVSKQLGEERVINVWTPPGYKDSTDSFPVMYMADGGINEDFLHIANTFASLIKNKTIPPMILVGIENTQRRRDLTGFTAVAEDKEIAPVVGGSAKFRAFINDELFLKINKRYKTTAKKGILGESLSGLFVVETFLQTPEMFDYYIAFDPSLWWNNHYLVSSAKEHLAKFPSTEKRIWFAGSATEDIAPYSRQFAETLKTENLFTLKWMYADEPNEKHSTIFRATKEKALKWTLSYK